MHTEFEIDAVSRSDQGKGASRRLRREGLVPGIIYGGSTDPQMFSTNHNELIRHLEQEAFFSHILTVKMDGEEQKVVLRDLQRHPSKPFILHVDLMRVRMDEEIRMTVPLHFKGEDDCPGVKAGGTVLHGMSDLEIECLPADLPEFIEIDVSQMAIDDVVHLSQVSMPKGVTLVEQIDEDNDPVVVTIEVVHVQVEEEEAAEEEAAPVVQPKAEGGEEAPEED
jgi:large subunit ribosomal protein L25